MNFRNKLIPGVLIKRYKRFFVDVKINNNIVTAHCPNTGSMMGLLKKGSKVWLSESDNPKRKLKFTLQMIAEKNQKVGINTHLTNKIILDALINKQIKVFENSETIKTEVKFGTNTRFDFLIINGMQKTFIEVKNVTLSRVNGVAEFPDAVTTRGHKHLNELIKASQKGYKIFILYLIQREDCSKFKIAKDIDPVYYKLLQKAVKKKLNVLCFDCKFSIKGIKLNRKINFSINE